MTDVLTVHPTHPQQRLLQQAVKSVCRGGVIVYPTDSGYAIGCRLGEKEAVDRIRRIRQLSKSHNFTLLCRDLSEIATYARVDNPTFRFLKAYTPGPFTFILIASKEVPRRLQHPKRKTIGIRIPCHPITLALLELLNEPLMSVSLISANDEFPPQDIKQILKQLEGQVDIIIEGGVCGIDATTVVDLTAEEPIIIRQGQGIID